jgi:hypothetical protein
MKIRTEYEFQEKISKDLLWRKREFTTLKFMIEGEKRPHQKEILYRSSIALLYAHWEGHIKFCASAYLDFISYKGFNLETLTENFSQVLLGIEFSGGFSIKSISNQKKIYDYFNNLSTKKFKVIGENTIDTESNLNFEVLKKIVDQLNLNISEYERRENFINGTLLKDRNRICHGEFTILADLESTYLDINEYLLKMIENFNSEIIDMVINKKYLKSSMGPKI